MKIRRSRRRWLIALSVLVAVVGVASLSAVMWYRQMLMPADISNKAAVRIDIKEGMNSGDIADSLEQKKLIRSSLAFSAYVRLHNASNKFQSGVYSVKPSQTVPEIVARLTSGKSDEISITFYPGATLHTKIKNSDGREVESVLKKAEFSDKKIKEAFNAKYTNPILASRPNGADLEGYVYGETFYISPNESIEQVIKRSLSHFEAVVKKYNLVEKFKARGLTLHQGITLASIIQKESIGCGAGAETCADQRKIASVFYNRLKTDMPLGSDVTYQYAADKTGAVRTPDLNSPYNTRKHKGLPPGPIAVPSLSALNAAADPENTPYKYFLSGDDDVTYFAVTNDEHEKNIKQHCQKKCQIS